MKVAIRRGLIAHLANIILTQIDFQEIEFCFHASNDSIRSTSLWCNLNPPQRTKLRLYEFRGEWHNLSCAQCQQRYDGSTAVKLGEIGLRKIEAAEDVDQKLLSATLQNLGVSHSEMGEAKKSQEMLERALAIAEHTYGREHARVAIILTNLGNACSELGDAEKAREVLERALVAESVLAAAIRQEGTDTAGLTFVGCTSWLSNFGCPNSLYHFV